MKEMSKLEDILVTEIFCSYVDEFNDMDCIPSTLNRADVSGIMHYE
jgi:hypothetical protein